MKKLNEIFSLLMKKLYQKLSLAIKKAALSRATFLIFGF